MHENTPRNLLSEQAGPDFQKKKREKKQIDLTCFDLGIANNENTYSLKTFFVFPHKIYALETNLNMFSLSVVDLSERAKY